MRHPFVEALGVRGDLAAMVDAGGTLTYASLHESVLDWNQYLDDRTVPSGAVVALEGRASSAFVAGLLALAARACIAVPLTDVPADQGRDRLNTAGVEIVIRTADGGEPAIERTGNRSGHPLYERLRAARAAGLVLFSSGSSGRPKAAVLDFGRMLRSYAPDRAGRRVLLFLNLDHIGGLNTTLHTLATGGTIVTVPDRDPESVFAAMARHAVQVLPTSPTFLTMALFAGAPQRHPSPALELITYGTEPMPIGTLRALRRALPAVRLKQTYGLSELGILPTRSRDDDSVWVEIGGSGFDYKVVDGILHIRSDTAMVGYLNAPSPFDSEGFFDTQDEVEIDGPYLRIRGRRSDVINVGGEKVRPEEVESVVLEVPNIVDAAASGRPNPVTGMVVVVTVRLGSEEDEREVARRVRAHCVSRLERYKVPVMVKVATEPLHNERFKKVRAAR